eukprot:494238-Amphidinium_carterae.1
MNSRGALRMCKHTQHAISNCCCILSTQSSGTCMAVSNALACIEILNVPGYLVYVVLCLANTV